MKRTKTRLEALREEVREMEQLLTDLREAFEE